MTINTISTLPTAPARTDAPATFVTRADAFLAALVVMQGELNTSIGQMNTDIPLAIAASETAVAAAASAVAAAGATEWVSGTTYAEGDAVWSPITYQTYRRKTDGAGTTDPSADTTNWEKISGVLPTQTGNADKFLTTDGTTASWANLPASAGSADFVASGAISTGDTVALKSDGTVEVISGSASTTLYTGIAATESFTNLYETQGVYDSVNNKIYIKWNNATSVYVKVGTPNGSTITWGADQTVTTSKYNNQFGDSGITYDPVADRVIVFYQDASNLPTFVAGVVTGTTIGFGTPVALSGVNFQEAKGWGFAYDTEHNVTHFAFENSSDGNASVIPVSVSGTTITLGTRFRPNTGHGVEGASVAYSVSLNKVIVSAWSTSTNAYFYLLDFDGTNYTLESTATVSGVNSGTSGSYLAYDDTTKTALMVGNHSNNMDICCAQIISGTITAGNSVKDLFASSYVYAQSVIFDTKSGVFWVATNQAGGNYAPYLAKVTVTSNVASAQTGLFYQADFAAGGQYTGLIHDSNTGINYATWNNTSYNTWYQIAFRQGYWSTNADSYIGIATQTVADAATLTVAIGAGSFDGLSGLTIGSEYWVNYDGSLVTFKTPFAKIGRALSSTKILCNGVMDSQQQDLLNPFVQYKDNMNAGDLIYLDGNGVAGNPSYVEGTSSDYKTVIDSTNFYTNGYRTTSYISPATNNVLLVWIGSGEYLYARMGTYDPTTGDVAYTSSPSILLSAIPYSKSQRAQHIIYSTAEERFFAIHINNSGYIAWYAIRDQSTSVSYSSSGYIYAGSAVNGGELAITWDDSRNQGIAMWHYGTSAGYAQAFKGNGTGGISTSGMGGYYDNSYIWTSISRYSIDGMYDSVNGQHIFIANTYNNDARLFAFNINTVTTPLTNLTGSGLTVSSSPSGGTQNYIRVALADTKQRILFTTTNGSDFKIVSVINNGLGSFDTGTGLSTTMTEYTSSPESAGYGELHYSDKVDKYLFHDGSRITIGDLDITTSNGQVDSPSIDFSISGYGQTTPTLGYLQRDLGIVSLSTSISSNYRTTIFSFEKLVGNFIGLADYTVTAPSKSSVTTVGGVNTAQSGLIAGAKYKASGTELAVDSTNGTMTALSETEILIRSI